LDYYKTNMYVQESKYRLEMGKSEDVSIRPDHGTRRDIGVEEKTRSLSQVHHGSDVPDVTGSTWARTTRMLGGGGWIPRLIYEDLEAKM